MKYLYLLLSIFITQTGWSQIHKCYTDQAHNIYIESEAARQEVYFRNEVAVRNWIQDNKQTLNRKQSSTVITIPVVFHIVYKNATQNIADSNIFRQITVMNEAFRLQNANFSQTRPIFDTIAADVEIEFCLANIDPSGSPTTGITRTQAPAGTFFDPLLGFDNVKSSATGGKDPWPNNQYLNIWVCDMSLLGLTVVLGYATFPGGDPVKDGVVIQYQFIGNMPNPTTSNEGKTTVHEVGHWLGLRHIWGDGQGSAALCDSTDYVDDTPNADSASQQTCIIKNTCSNESPYWTLAGIDPPDMYENYMDYSYDACMTMFTNGQKARMLGFLNTVRAGLLNSPGCSTVGLNEYDNYPVSVFPNPSKGIFTIRSGSSQLVNCTITDLAGRVIIASQLWPGNNTIDLSPYPSGIFLYRTESGKAGKLVKTD